MSKATNRRRGKTATAVTGIKAALKEGRRYVHGQTRDTGTPERIARALGAIGHTDDGATRLADAPLDRLHAKRQLDRDPTRNRILYMAADAYREDWLIVHTAELSALDPTETVAVSPRSRVPQTTLQERISRARHRYDRARASLPRDYVDLFEAVILREMSIQDAAARWTRYTGTSAKQQGAAVVIDRLAQCCDCLVRHSHGRG